MQDLSYATATYTSLGALLDYPSAEYGKKVVACRDELAKNYPEATQAISQFLVQIADMPVEMLEELYTRTFDVAPLCIPYVTAYIYGGESFERGDLMSKLAEIYQRYQFDTGGELPDHLGVLLKFAAHLDAGELEELVDYCLRRPLGDMVTCLEGSDNPFALIIRAIRLVLNSDFPEEKQHG